MIPSRLAIAGNVVLLGACLRVGLNEPYQVVELEFPAGGIVVGDDRTPVVLLEFGNPTCPACRHFADSVLPMVEARFVEAGTLQYRYAEAGPRQVDVLSAAIECASLTAGFSQARAAFYGRVDAALDSASVVGQSSECVLDSMRARRRHAERALAERLRVPGTPTFVVGRFTPPGRVVGWVIVGGISRDSMTAVLEFAVRRFGAVDEEGRGGVQ